MRVSSVGPWVCMLVTGVGELVDGVRGVDGLREWKV